MTPYIITNNLWDIEGVKQYRFIQEDVKDYTIWLNGDPAKMEDVYKRQVQKSPDMHWSRRRSRIFFSFWMWNRRCILSQETSVIWRN